MDTFDQAMDAAFWRVWPVLVRDGAELRRRVGRRGGKMFAERVPREVCAAVRAGDLRINAWRTALVPERAFDRDERGPVDPADHEVELTADLLREVCAPVWLEWPGLPLREAGPRLGYHPETLRSWLGAGTLRERVERVAHGNRFGSGGVHRRVVVWSPGPLDPARPKGRPAYWWWGDLWQHVAEGIPADFRQVVRRGPRWLAYRREARFRGWRWECPGCGKPAKWLYLPTPGAVFLAEWASRTELMLKRGDVPDAAAWTAARRVAFGLDEAERFGLEPRATLACGPCHGVTFGSKGQANGWNQLVAALSGGLLYGREVAMPEHA